jgi:two-component system, NarL family, nitrate/nitrite response regulator NarL
MTVASRILIIDDHPLVAHGLGASLRGYGHEVEAISGPTPEAILSSAQGFQPDLVLIDLMLGDVLGSGIDLIGPLRALALRIVVLTGTDDRLLLAQALEAGADAVVGKGQGLDVILGAVWASLDGRDAMSASLRAELLQGLQRHRSATSAILDPIMRLTPREQIVLTALMRGQSADEIAAAETVGLATVRTQIRSILQKLNVRSQLAAVAVARRAGWGDGPTAASGQTTSDHQHW